MAKKIDALVKLGLVASFLLASSGVGYYYVIYLPRRDAQLENERRLDKARLDAEQRAVQARLASEQQAAEQRRLAAQAAAQLRYQACLNSANANHDASWAAECKSLAEKSRQDRANCLDTLKLPRAYCDSSYTDRDASPNCSLPEKVSTVLDAALQRARDLCLLESKAALQ